MYLSTGAKMTSHIIIGDNVTVGANSIVNKSYPEGNALLVGGPAIKKHERLAWYDEENGIFQERVTVIENRKKGK